MSNRRALKKVPSDDSDVVIVPASSTFRAPAPQLQSHIGKWSGTMDKLTV